MFATFLYLGISNDWKILFLILFYFTTIIIFWKVVLCLSSNTSFINVLYLIKEETCEISLSRCSINVKIFILKVNTAHEYQFVLGEVSKQGLCGKSFFFFITEKFSQLLFTLSYLISYLCNRQKSFLIYTFEAYIPKRLKIFLHLQVFALV